MVCMWKHVDWDGFPQYKRVTIHFTGGPVAKTHEVVHGKAISLT